MARIAPYRVYANIVNCEVFLCAKAEEKSELFFEKLFAI